MGPTIKKLLKTKRRLRKEFGDSWIQTTPNASIIKPMEKYLGKEVEVFFYKMEGSKKCFRQRIPGGEG